MTTPTKKKTGKAGIYPFWKMKMMKTTPQGSQRAKAEHGRCSCQGCTTPDPVFSDAFFSCTLPMPASSPPGVAPGVRAGGGGGGGGGGGPLVLVGVQGGRGVARGLDWGRGTTARANSMNDAQQCDLVDRQL